MSDEKKPIIKSYVERFADVEKLLESHQQGLTQQEMAINFHSRVVQDLVNEIKQLNQTLNGVIRAAEAKQVFTLDDVVSVIAETNAKTLKDQIAKEESAGKIIPVETVEDKDTLVVFSALPDFLYGYSVVEAFKDEEIKVQLIGKKVGDKVKDVEILSLYRIKPEETKANESEQN